MMKKPPEPEYETDNSLNKLDVYNRLALGGSALALTGTAMFTALAAYTGNSGSALVYGGSALLQVGLAAWNVGHVYFPPRAARGEKAEPNIVNHHCRRTFARMAGIAVIACSTALLAPPDELNVPGNIQVSHKGLTSPA